MAALSASSFLAGKSSENHSLQLSDPANLEESGRQGVAVAMAHFQEAMLSATIHSNT